MKKSLLRSATFALLLTGLGVGILAADVSLKGQSNPALWGQKYPEQFELYANTAKTAELVDYSKVGKYGGPEDWDRLKRYPLVKRIFAGMPFSVDYKEDRGHLDAIKDVFGTARLGDAKPGACMTCKSSQVPEVMAAIGPEKFYATPMKELHAQFNFEHPVSCADCHDGETMKLTITRPAFKEAMARRGVDVSKAKTSEMRTYVCAQCHVEYYFKGSGRYVTFPWDNGLNIDQIDAYYQEIGFTDWTHAETKAGLVKMQHPEFELWSTGIHARSGVSCSDCHMGATTVKGKEVTDHWLRSPLLNTQSCTECHSYDDAELRARVIEIQDRTFDLQGKAEVALVAAQDAIVEAMKAGATDQALANARALERKASMRWDFIASENSMGFHSPQEAVRVLGNAIDYARQAEVAAIKAKPPGK